MAGTFSNQTGRTSAAGCLLCTAGRYCDTVALAAPAGPCAAGYYCTGGSPTAQPTDSTGGPCPRGSYCPAGSPQPLPCPPGTFGNTTMAQAQAECSTCPRRPLPVADFHFGRLSMVKSCRKKTSRELAEGRKGATKHK